jgi:hypothetical protein
LQSLLGIQFEYFYASSLLFADVIGFRLEPLEPKTQDEEGTGERLKIVD